MLLGVTWLATRVLVVKTDLEASQALVSQVQQQAGEFNFADLAATSAELEARASSAAAGSHDLTWRITEFVPVIGQNLTAVRIVAESIDDITSKVVAPAVSLAASFDVSARDPESGGFDLSPLAEARTIAASATTVFTQAQTKVDSIDTTGTLGPVAAAVTQLKTVLPEASSAVAGLTPMLDAAGTALGENGARTYVMAFQNNAEATALGGSAASYTVLGVDRGAVAIQAQGAGSQDLLEGERVDVEVDQSAIDLYSDYLVRFPNTSTSRPDFPTAAEIIRAYWIRDKGITADGVISVDPLALAQILKATGPIALPSGDVISSDNAVSLLVHDIYYRIDSYAHPEETDAFFQSAASAILTKVLSGEFDMKAMATALSTSVNSGSIMMWSANPEEQVLLDGTRIQGALPATNDDATVIGTYFRDTSASKIDYYLQTSTKTTTDLCTSPESPTFTQSVTLQSLLSEDEAESLPDYVNSANYGSDKFSTQVFVYGPVGASVTDARVDTEGVGSIVDDGGSDLGRPVAKFTVFLAPGESSTVTASFAGAPGAYGPLELRGTPMLNPIGIVPPAACG